MELFVLAILASTTPLQIDSSRLSHQARDAQADFELTRRQQLPSRPGRGGPCDERIGRFCYWRDEDDPATPPEEPRRIRDARDRLVRRLDSLAALVPGDEWIAGQRVRYLVESGRTSDALAATHACRAARWWCEALAGFALHAAANYAAADSVYAAALGDMPPEERCRWTDLSVLLDGALARRYRPLGCGAAERDAFAARLWWLARPFYSLPGNDRRTEHFSRITMGRLAANSRTAYGVSWGDDLRELTLRYGWPAYWTRQPPGPGFATDLLVTGHDPDSAVHLIPDAGAFDDPGSAPPGAWALDPPRPRELYEPAYARLIAPLEHQVAVFRRGDSCLAVAAYDVGGDTLFAGAALDAALVLAPDERSTPIIERRPAAGLSDVMVGKAECRPLLLSFEVVAPGRRHAARARYGLRPPGGAGAGVALSDILLFDPPPPPPPPTADSLPTELAAVLRFVRPSTTLRPDTRLGLFWEVYGLDPAGETVTTAVHVVPERTGWLRRATQAVGLTRRRSPVRVEWQETLRPGGRMAARALALELAGLEPGRYRVEVVVHPVGRAPAVATRQIEVKSRATAARSP